MLVSQDDFVKIHGYGNLVILKVTQPRPFTVDGIGQQRKNVAKWNGNLISLRSRFEGGDGVIFRPVIYPQSRFLHSLQPCSCCLPDLTTMKDESTLLYESPSRLSLYWP